jgi:hypothetical protein
VDLIWLARRGTSLAVECKWSAKDFDPANLLVFARAYPNAELLVATTDAHPGFIRELDGRRIRFLTLDHLVRHLEAVKAGGRT